MLARVRYAIRQLRQSPGFALTAVLTLALGIGASTALFAVLDAVLLHPLPFAQPNRLVAIRPMPDGVASIPTVQDWQKRSHSLASLAAYRPWTPEQGYVHGVWAERVLGVTQGFFSTLGTHFAQGHGWAMTNNEADCTQEAVVSGQFWHRLGGGALGTLALQFEGKAFPITGVLPMDQQIEGLRSLNGPDAFVQVGCIGEATGERGDGAFEVLGRLRPGISLTAARADLEQTDRQLRAEYPNEYAQSFGRPPEILPYVGWLVGADTKTTLLATFAACGLLLAIACANLTNLLLARATRRREEWALRATLGATLGQMLAQMLIESALLVSLGTGAGLLFAAGLLRLLKGAATLRLPRLAHAALEPRVLLFAVAISSMVAVIITVLPARRVLRPELLREVGSGHSSLSGSLKRAGRFLVVAQLTLTLVLVACAGWLTASVYVLLHQPLGFTPDRLLLAHVQFSGYHSKKDAVDTEQKIKDVTATLRAVPGVTAVAATDHQPLGHAVNRYAFASDAHADKWHHPVTLNPNSFAVNPGYFAAIGQTLLEGRDFNAADDGRNPVAIVNRALAAREWPGQSAIGHQIRSGELESVNKGYATVIGIAANIHNSSLDAAPEPDLYIPRSQDPSGYAILAMRIEDKLQIKPEVMARTVEAVLRKRYPEATSRYVESMDEVMAHEVAQRAFLMRASAAFAAGALFLAILGTYGLLAYEVSLREKEIGIRLALGSSREAIVRLLLRQEGRWLALGCVLGLTCAALAGYALRARFYGARSTALPVLLISAALLVVPAVLAIALPARRASMQDPAEMLRRE